MGIAKRVVAAAAVATVALGTLTGTAAAHERKFDWVYSASISDTEIQAQAALTSGNHAGTLRITLKKKVGGEWKTVTSKVAKYGDDGYFTAVFEMLGDEKCKVFAKHTAEGHPTIKKAGNSFDC